MSTYRAFLRSPLLDRAGERLGRVEDLIVRLADGGYPPVTGLKARIGGRELFVPVDRVAALEPGAVRLAGEKLSLGKFERRVGEVLLGQDVLARKLVNVEADPPRLVTAHEIELVLHRGLVAGGRRRSHHARAAAPDAAAPPARADR